MSIFRLPPTSHRFWRFAFFTAATFSVLMAALPQQPGSSFWLSDKALHGMAFAFLTLLARMAYPRARSWRLLLALGALGAGIELFQFIPILGREASLADWLADLAAILCTLALFDLLRWLAGSKSPGAQHGANR